jgi:hypothetical protein
VVGVALWTVSPRLTFFVAAVLGAGAVWAALWLPAQSTVRR